jgi:hypothetical protein
MACRSNELQALWHERARALAQFEEWERVHVSETMSPAERFEAAATVYEWLPAERRHRPVATEGVAALHRRLRVLMPSA